jgi:hypothetical protein
MTTVRATRYVDCPFSAVIEFCEEALHERSDITLSPAPGVAQAAHVTAQTADDITDSVRRHDALLLAWRPARSALFPDFHGVMTVRPQGHGAWLRIEGSYEPPFGVPGKVFDALAGRVIAQRTLVRLLSDVAHAAEQRWRAFRTEIIV